MKRLHVHINVGVDQFSEAAKFYGSMLGAEPTKEKPGYRKWLVDAPAINLVIEETSDPADLGVHHLGLQVDEHGELTAIEDRIQSAKLRFMKIGETLCCYSASEKSWTSDPIGTRWELFRSFADLDAYGAKTDEEKANSCG